MRYMLLFNRKIRRYLKKRLGEKVFDSLTFQFLLGYRKRGSTILEKAANIHIQYDLCTDIGQALFFVGLFEEAEISFFENRLKSKTAPVILDIGANIGIHSIRWAKINDKCKVFAFEPSPSTRDALEENLHINSISDQVIVIPEAVSDKIGNAKFYVCDDDAYSSLKDTKRKSVIKTIETPVTTIDDFIHTFKLQNISLIKIDVEGFETNVIRGGLHTLKSYKPDLFVEIYGGKASNPHPEETIQMLCSLGYKIYVLKDGKAIQYKKHNDSMYNYFFTFEDLELT